MENLFGSWASYKLPIVLFLVGTTLVLSGFFSSAAYKQFFNQQPKNYSSKSLVATNEISKIKIDVAGGVNNPGVYSVDSGSRIQDAVKVAGGFSTSANYQYISKSINLSQKISDGQKIYIPTSGENYSSTTVVGAVEGSVGGQIGINSADAQKLDQLPGIGAVTAGKIIASRPYGSIDELLSKKVVSKSVFDKIKGQIDLN